MEKSSSHPDPKVLEQYRQQIMDMYQRHPLQDDDWLDREFPEPKPIRAAADVAEEAPPTPPIAETPFVGYLRVYVTTAEEAQPIADAYVTVTREGVAYANTVTDRDGYTQVIPLPALDPALTLKPGEVTPYISYDIRVIADGFRSTQYNNVPVYGNNYVTQPAVLHPLLYSDNPDDVQEFVSGGPENL